MERFPFHRTFIAVTSFAFALSLTVAAKAQETAPTQGQQSDDRPPITSLDSIHADITHNEANLRQKADGHRHGQPPETYAVAPGTKFLVSLQDELGTKGTRQNDKFKVRTLEPLEAGNGIYLPAGAEVRGHISHVESAGIAGRAKIWLTIDDIHTSFGELPLVAEVIDVPGDHSVKTGGPKREGLIEGRTSTQEDAAEAAAAAAALGAVKGLKDKDKKEAAEGAALAAFTAYLMESGRGHELNLPKGTKLELELERTLYLLKD